MVSINIIDGSRLVEVKYTADNPESAALVVNTLFKKYIDFNLESASETTHKAAEFVNSQIEDMRKKLKEKEMKLNEYTKKKDSIASAAAKLAEINKAYTNAQISRIQKESIFQELKGKSFENYPQVRKDSVIQTLKKDYSTLEAKYQEKSHIYKPAYPEMRRMESQMSYIQQRIANETQALGRNILLIAESEYETAKTNEESLEKLIQELKKVGGTGETNEQYYGGLQIEVDNMRTLLSQLVRKQSESAISSRLEDLQASNIRVIDWAEVPVSQKSSKKVMLLMVALFMGIGAGAGVAFGLEILLKTFHTASEAERSLRAPAWA